MKLTHLHRTSAGTGGRTAPRAFCTLLVIASMVFLGMAVMSITTLFAHEARRTHSALAQTQLRQLLSAAIPAAQAEMLARPGTHDADVPVPVAGATLHLHIDGQSVTVQAAYRGLKAAQTLTFAAGKLTGATLDDSGL